MSIARARITFEPRNTTNCIDLAVKFVGARLPRILAMWFVVAVPACSLVYALSNWFSLGFATAAGIVLLATSPLGVLVSLDAIPAAMGQVETREAFLLRLKKLGPELLRKGLGWRLLIGAGMMLCVAPGFWLAVRQGFFVERACFSRDDDETAQSRVDRLLQESMGDLVARAIWIVLFSACAAMSIFLLLDYVASLFNIPLLVGRVAESLPSYDQRDQLDPNALVQNLFYLLLKDPLVLTSLAAAALLVYPIGRLAWFFCYVDVRVRRDLWDTEREFTRLAAHLKRKR